MPLDLTSTTKEKVPVYSNPTTTDGDAAQLDGKAIITILTGGATTAPASDQEIADSGAAGFPGLVGFVISEDVTGISTWSISGDADLGAGVETITDGGTYSYNHPNAANFGLTAGAPVPKA